MMSGHAGQFSMDSNGDKLASYSILALNHSAAAFNTAWTLRTQFIGNCSEEDHHCPLETTFTPSVQIVWPGSCEDRIYKSVAIKRFGVCNAESVLQAPLDFPLCGYRGVLCPPKAPSEVDPSTISLVSLITIVLG